MQPLTAPPLLAARGLATRGVGQGDRVVLILPNTPEFLVVWFALATLRAIAVLVNTAFRAGEMAYPLAHARPRLVVAAVVGVPSAFAEEDIAAFKVPVEVRFVRALPKTPTQKVRRSALRTAYLDAPAGEGR